jgi:plastocyanin
MVADNGSFDSGRVGPSATGSVTLSQRGSFAYHCTLHPSMTGTIVVQ